MKSLPELADMRKSGEKVDVFASHRGRRPKRNIREKRRNANRSIQKAARQKLKREMYEDLEQ